MLINPLILNKIVNKTVNISILFIMLFCYVIFFTLLNLNFKLNKKKLIYYLIMFSLVFLILYNPGNSIFFSDDKLLYDEADKFTYEKQEYLYVQDKIIFFTYYIFILMFKNSARKLISNFSQIIYSISFVIFFILAEKTFKSQAKLVEICKTIKEYSFLKKCTLKKNLLGFIKHIWVKPDLIINFILQYICLLIPVWLFAYSNQIFPNYNYYGYFWFSIIVFLIVRVSENREKKDLIYLIPSLILVAILYRQESILLFVLFVITLFIYKRHYLKIKKLILLLVIFVLIYIPIFNIQFANEFEINLDDYDINIIHSLDNQGIHDKEIFENIKNAGHPSIKNYYYNTVYRQGFFNTVVLISLFAICINFIFRYKHRLVNILCITFLLYFIMTFGQHYSVGIFERFYFYLVTPGVIISIYVLIKLSMQIYNYLLKK